MDSTLDANITSEPLLSSVVAVGSRILRHSHQNSSNNELSMPFPTQEFNSLPSTRLSVVRGVRNEASPSLGVRDEASPLLGMRGKASPSAVVLGVRVPVAEGAGEASLLLGMRGEASP